MATQSVTTEYYDTDGNVIDTITTIVDVPSQEEIIAQKEQELITMYNEIVALKAQLGE